MQRVEMDDLRSEAHRAIDEACECGRTVEVITVIRNGLVETVKESVTEIRRSRRGQPRRATVEQKGSLHETENITR